MEKGEIKEHSELGQRKGKKEAVKGTRKERQKEGSRESKKGNAESTGMCFKRRRKREKKTILIYVLCLSRVLMVALDHGEGSYDRPDLPWFLLAQRSLPLASSV